MVAQHARPVTVSPARACAFAVVRRVFERGAYADRAFRAESRGLERRERAFAMQLAYGTVQRRAAVDHVAARLASRPFGELDPHVVAAVRLGLFELLFLGGVAPHAAVNESVELVKRSGGGGTALVNAVLRRGAREGHEILDELDDTSPGEAAIIHSVPEWLAVRWWSELGADDARRLLRWSNEPAESALRVNLLASTLQETLSRLPVPARPAPSLPEGIVLGAPFDAHGSELWQMGAIMPQSRGSMAVARVLGPRPGERVLDLCAAPGAKTTHIAALMHDVGTIVAVERHRGRANALVQTCARMRAGSARVEVGEASDARTDAKFDRVLADPPCSGLGTLQSRPDVRWRTSAAGIRELAAQQRRILAAGAAATAPGGALVYSVCTISRAESEEVVDGLLRERSDFIAEDLASEHPQWTGPHGGPYLQLMPHRDETDGFFIARLRRKGRRAVPLP